MALVKDEIVKEALGGSVIRRLVQPATKGIARKVLRQMYGKGLGNLKRFNLLGVVGGVVTAFPTFIMNVVEQTVRNKAVLRYFTHTNPTILAKQLGKRTTKELDDVIKHGVENGLKNVPKGDKLLTQGILDSEGGRVYIQKLIKGEISEINDPNILKGMLKNVDKDFATYMKTHKRAATNLLGWAKVSRFAAGTVLTIAAAAQLYSWLLSAWDMVWQQSGNANKSIAYVIGQLEDMIDNGLFRSEQRPTFILKVKKAINTLKKLNVQLSRAKFTRLNRNVKDSEMVVFLKAASRGIKSKIKTVGDVIKEIDFTFDAIITLLNEYKSNVTDFLSLGHGASAHEAKQVAVAIQNARKEMSVLMAQMESIDNIMSKSVKESQNKEATITEDTQYNQITKTAFKNFVQATYILKKKLLIIQAAETEDKADDIYTELASTKAKKEKPGAIMEAVGKVVAPIVLTVLPMSIAANPARFKALLSLIDAAVIKSNATMTPKLMSFLASKGFAGVATGAGAAGVITSLFGGLDIGHSIAAWIFIGNNLKSKIVELISLLNAAEGIKGTKWSKLSGQLQSKLMGTAYDINKGISELSKNQIIEKKLTDQNIQKFINSINAMNKINGGIVDIMEVMNILKQEKTRDIYIEHGESVMGAAARSVDAAVNFVSTFGGLLGSRNIGENPSGFANIYNTCMDYVEAIEANLIEIQKKVLPYKANLEKFQAQLHKLAPFIEKAAKEIEEGKLT